jgi:short-subunit dehydrogenase
MNKSRQTALITGATGGIGFEIAKLFAQKNISLLLVARNEAKLLEIEKDFEIKYNIEVNILALDLSVPDAYLKVPEFIKLNNLNVDYLVNNAGYGYQDEFLKGEVSNYTDMINLNVTTLTNLTFLLGRQMAERGSGKILNIASVAAFQPDPYFAVYGATKAYVRSFSAALYHELKGSGVCVTTLSPGLTYTGFIERAGMRSDNLMGKMAMKSEVVALAGFNALMKNKREVVPGFFYKMMAFFSQTLPVSDFKLKYTGDMMKPSHK